MHHRQRGQTFVIAALAMTCMLGALSMVVDAGVYFVIQRELQNAADAAALDAVWYDPACPSSNWASAGCQASNSRPTAPDCLQPQNVPPKAPPNNNWPCTAAAEQVYANWGVALSLCAGPQQSATGVIQITAGPVAPVNGFSPSVSPYAVTVSCYAPHWFARILPGVKAGVQISASAAAALGWLDSNGELKGDPRPITTPPTPLVARLFLTQPNS